MSYQDAARQLLELSTKLEQTENRYKDVRLISNAANLDNDILKFAKTFHRAKRYFKTWTSRTRSTFFLNSMRAFNSFLGLLGYTALLGNNLLHLEHNVSVIYAVGATSAYAMEAFLLTESLRDMRKLRVASGGKENLRKMEDVLKMVE